MIIDVDVVNNQGVDVNAVNSPGVDVVVDRTVSSSITEYVSDLPDVTNDDNGKLLQVVGGEWQAAEYDGDKLLMVTFTTDDTGTIHASHTTAQIYEWVENGGFAIAKYGMEMFVLNACALPMVRFISVMTNNKASHIVMNQAGLVVKQTNTTTPLPLVTADNNGNVLQVVDGVWQAADGVELGNSVKKYGAKGDGTTDDTTAFQNALAENRIVYVPEGTYKLTGGLVIGANCRLEMTQATVLDFNQTTGNCIELRSSATLNGNHGVIQVPYGFTGNVICADTTNDATSDTPPYEHWTPQWKRARYIYDVCIVKPDPTYGLHYSLDGTCSGTGIYMSCEGTAEVGYIWGAMLQGIRIAGAFTYGIRAINFDDPDDSMEDDAWNHDMRIEAVIQGCEVSASLTNCNHAHLAVTVQPSTANNGAKYAKWGVYLNDCKNIDMTQSFIWDWHVARDGEEYTHVAMYGNCKGLVINEPRYFEPSVREVRDIFYTDTPSNLENMVVLQEPITRWFKVKDGEPYYNDGDRDRKIATQDDIDAHFTTERVKGFTDALSISKDANGAIYNGIGYKRGGYFDSAGNEKQATGNEYDYYISTGYIPVKAGDVLYFQNISFDTAISLDDASLKLAYFDANKNFRLVQSGVTMNKSGTSGYYQKYERTEDGMKITMNSTLSEYGSSAFVRFVFHKYDFGENPVISVNEEIKYTQAGFLADGIKVKGDAVVLSSTGGKAFKLVVSDTGALSTEAL